MKELEILYKILEKRGLKTEEDIEKYLNPDETLKHDIKLLDGFDLFRDRLNSLSNQKQTVVFWCEKDIDKIIGLYFIKKCIYDNSNVFIHFIEKEEREKTSKERLFNEKVDTLIILGKNTFSPEEVIQIKNNNIKLINISNEKKSDELNSFFDLYINPNSEISTYPFKELSFSNLCLKMYKEIIGEDYQTNTKYFGMALIGTVNSGCKLIEENRYYAKLGMDNFLNNGLILHLVRKNRGKNIAKTRNDIDDVFSKMTKEALKVCEASFINNMIESNDKEPYIIEDSINKIINFSRVYRQKKGEDKIILNAEKSLIYEDGDYIIKKINDIDNEIYKDAIKAIALEKRKNMLVVDNEMKFIYYDLKESDFSDKFKNNIDGIDKSVKRLVTGKMTGVNIEDVINIILTCKVKNENVVVNYDYELKIEDFNYQLEKELLKMEPTGVGNWNARFKIENVSFRNISEFSGKSTCQIDDGKNSKNIWYFGHKNIDTQWTYDIIIDSNYQLLDMEKKEFINRSFEKGLDNRDVSILGVTAKKKEELNKRNIFTVNDILEKTPIRYIDTRFPKKVDEMFEMVNSGNLNVISTIGTIQQIKSGPKIKTLLECKDDDGSIFYVGWFYDWVRGSFYSGERCFFTGKLSRYGKNVIIYPDGINYCGRDIENLKRINPYYTSTSSPSNEYIKTRIKTAIDYTNKEDYLEDDIIEKFGLDIRKDAFRMIHSPESDSDIKRGRDRFLFDELFKFSLNLNIQNKEKNSKNNIIFEPKKTKETFEKIIPYTLTNDQKRAIDIIIDGCKEGEKFEGLLQANVGHGKTIIAIYFAILAASNGYQTAVLAPTEILAKQHYSEFSKYLNSFGIKSACLAGKMSTKEKRLIYDGVKNGFIKVLIGTNAVINRDFKNLGLIVCDEQHKFGVKQREKLYEMGNNPHYLSMSATPIPRSLCMSVYGSGVTILDLKEKPGNRPDVVSIISNSKEMTDEYIINEVSAGHQVYIVCPAIEDGVWADLNGVASVKSVEGEISKLIKKSGLNVKYAVLTGKTKTEELNNIMTDFKEGNISIIISTTVVEVGVDVENATLMVIKNSDRLGIAQLHQLRGRVGRGNSQSYAIFVSKDSSENSAKRLSIILHSNDGFKIADEDLKMRGPGEFFGEKQSGIQSFNIANTYKDYDVFKLAMDDAKSILNEDDKLTSSKYSFIGLKLDGFLKKRYTL